MNIARIWVMATNVFREVIRDRILYLIVFFGIVLLAANVLLPEVSANNQTKMLIDLGIAAIGIGGLVVAIFVGTGLVTKEIEKRTVYVLVSKPISPVEFIVGKHLGLFAVLAVMVVAMTAIYFIVLSVNQIAYPIDSMSLASLFLLIELGVITAVAIAFSVFTTSLLATILTFAVYLMGHLSRDLVLLTSQSENSDLQRMIHWAYRILPDLGRLDLKNQAVYGMGLLPSPLELLSNAGYGLLYMVLLLAIATAIFARREF